MIPDQRGEFKLRVYETEDGQRFRRALKVETISGANLWNRVGSLRASSLMQRLINKSSISILCKDMLPCLLDPDLIAGASNEQTNPSMTPPLAPLPTAATAWDSQETITSETGNGSYTHTHSHTYS